MIPDICSMYILLAAATSFEIQPAIDFLAQSPSPLSGHETGFLLTGVGPVSTTWSLMRQIGSRRPDLIIQAGIAGCFTGTPPPTISAQSGAASASTGHSIPALVLAIREDSLADLGVWEEQRFKTVFDLNLAEKDRPPFSDGLLVNPYGKLLELSGLETVRSITVSEITTDPTRIAWYQQNGAPVVESMEGGALHYVCLQENIPFLQLRSISNEIGQRDKTKWNIKGAIGSLNDRLIALLQRLADAETGILDRHQ